MKLVKYVFTLLFLLVFPSVGFSMPIQPQHLLKLSTSSEVIVFGKVQSIEKLPKKEDSLSTSKATINVFSVLKGEIASQQIYVYFSPSLICPEPPQYKKGETVLAFLKSDKQDFPDGYITAGLSYGTKALPPEDLVIYKERIQEILEINKEENKTLKDKQIIEWLVRCIEHPATFWEGAYGLFDKKSFTFKIIQRPGKKAEFLEDSLLDMLNSEQRIRVKNALFSSPTIDAGQLILVQMLKTDDDIRFLPFVMEHLKKSLDNPSYDLDKLMLIVGERKNNKQAIALAKDYSNISTDEEKKSLIERKKLLTSFLALVEK